MTDVKLQQAQNQASYLESLAHQMEQWVKHKYLILFFLEERIKNNWMSIQPAQYNHSISPGKECLVFVYQPHIQTGCVPTKPAEANVQFHKNC